MMAVSWHCISEEQRAFGYDITQEVDVYFVWNVLQSAGSSKIYEHFAVDLLQAGRSRTAIVLDLGLPSIVSPVTEVATLYANSLPKAARMLPNGSGFVYRLRKGDAPPSAEKLESIKAKGAQRSAKKAGAKTGASAAKPTLGDAAAALRNSPPQLAKKLPSGPARAPRSTGLDAATLDEETLRRVKQDIGSTPKMARRKAGSSPPGSPSSESPMLGRALPALPPSNTTETHKVVAEDDVVPGNAGKRKASTQPKDSTLLRVFGRGKKKKKSKRGATTLSAENAKAESIAMQPMQPRRASAMPPATTRETNLNDSRRPSMPLPREPNWLPEPPRPDAIYEAAEDDGSYGEGLNSLYDSVQKPKDTGAGEENMYESVRSPGQDSTVYDSIQSPADTPGDANYEAVPLSSVYDSIKNSGGLQSTYESRQAPPPSENTLGSDGYSVVGPKYFGKTTPELSRENAKGSAAFAAKARRKEENAAPEAVEPVQALYTEVIPKDQRKKRQESSEEEPEPVQDLYTEVIPKDQRKERQESSEEEPQPDALYSTVTPKHLRTRGAGTSEECQEAPEPLQNVYDALPDDEPLYESVATSKSAHSSSLDESSSSEEAVRLESPYDIAA